MTAGRTRRMRCVRRDAAAELVLGLCHEIGNVLAATRLAAHLVANDLAGPDLAQAAAGIEVEAARAGALLGQIRPLLAGRALRRLRVSAAEVLDALERSLGAAASGPRQLAIRKPRNVPDLSVDPDALHHVLVALVLAAAESVPTNGHVTVSARRGEAAIVVTVEDDGRPLEARPPAGAPLRRGRQLVLAAAAAVVRTQGGSLRVEPRARGGGTRVRITLRSARA